MAIANGTCVSFCNQPKAHYFATSREFCHCGYRTSIWLRQESKAHFDFPWVHPWDNRGKCYMDRKRIQYLSNASQHVPIYLQPFLVIEPESSKVRHFSTFFVHILASPGYGHGTMEVNVHGSKGNSMLVKRLGACTHLSSTVSEI